MVNKPSHDKKEARLDIPLSIKERTLVRRAADILHLAPAVFGRATILERADKIVAEHKAAR